MFSRENIGGQERVGGRMELTVKAFIDDKLVVAPATGKEDAIRQFDGYRTTVGCSAAYIYQEDRIVQSWDQSYDDYLEAQESTIGSCPTCCAPVFDDQERCDECGGWL